MVDFNPGYSRPHPDSSEWQKLLQKKSVQLGDMQRRGVEPYRVRQYVCTQKRVYGEQFGRELAAIRLMVHDLQENLPAGPKRPGIGYTTKPF